MSASLEAARAAKAVLVTQLAGDSRVAGVGVAGTEGAHSVKVNLVDGADRPSLPDEVDGVPVVVTVVGQVRADEGAP